MSKNCKSLKDITMALFNGEDPDIVIPYDLSHFSDDCYYELLALYIKYGKNEDRIKICKEKLYESR